MPSAVNMQLTHFLKPHSFSHCCLLLLGLSIKRGYRIGGGGRGGTLPCYTAINKRSFRPSSERRGFVCALRDGSPRRAALKFC